MGTKIDRSIAYLALSAARHAETCENILKLIKSIVVQGNNA